MSFHTSYSSCSPVHPSGKSISSPSSLSSSPHEPSSTSKCNFYYENVYCANMDMYMEPFSVEIAARNIGKKVYYHYNNCECFCRDDGSDPSRKDLSIEEIFGCYFIPDGDLVYENKYEKDRNDIVYKNWLQNQSTFELKKGMFVYLTGVANFGENKKRKCYMQISDPLDDHPWKGIRPLSHNSIGGENWVKKGVY